MATMSGPESTAWGLDVAARESTTGDDLDAPTWDLDLVEAALRLIQRKWTLRVINALWVDDLRYHRLEHRLRIQAKVLSESLRGLERDGIVTRVFGPGTPTPVMYALTPLGRSFGSMLIAMQLWAFDHVDEVRQCQHAKDAEADIREPR